MNETFDTLICGGSLAGSAAATCLAGAGYSVAVIDRTPFPRPKLCGGLLTWKSVRLIETLFRETPETLAEAGAVNFASDRYVIRTPKGTLAEGDLSFPFHFADRTVLDHLLQERARRAGATIIEGEVAACDPLTGEVACRDGRTLKGRYVIGADGANSVVRRSFPTLDRRRMRTLTAPTIEIRLPIGNFPKPLPAPELYIGFLEAGYGWVFPNRDHAVIGICGLRRNQIKISQVFKDFLDFLEIDPAAVDQLHGHPLPYGNYLDDPVHGVTLLAGDAGGFVEPLFGEGIFFALCTGMYAGRAVAGALEGGTDPGPVYRERLRRTILPELRGSDRLRWALFRGMQCFGSGSLGWFIRPLARPLGDMVHGKRSYHWLRKKRWDF